jgi:phage protein D/phage baseplate assembly protein gpV
MTNNSLNVSQISIKVAGALLPDEAVGDLLEVTVDHSLHVPSMFTIRLHSHDMKWLEDETFREGKKVEISFGEQSAVKLLSGKIAALEPDLNEAAPSMVVRGYDLSHALYRGRKRRSFNNLSDSDIAKNLASESSLQPGTIDSTSDVHDYVFQNNQTNAEFLLERAGRLGFDLWVEDDKLNFQKPQATGEPIKIEWGKNLRSFRPRLSTAEQVNEVEVRGWDPKQKKEVVGRATIGQGAPQIGIAQAGADIAKTAWGEAKLAIVDNFVRSPAEADKLAQAALDRLAASFVEADGACDGNGDIRAGKQVQIDGVGNRFNGTYYVTQVVHHWTKDQGLKTHFSISGRRDRSVMSLLQDVDNSANARVMNVIVGIVTNNKDPLEMGRVRVKFPSLSADDESAWARMVAPMAGDGRGFFYLPEVDDEVLVGFESGDIHRPFVIGALWNGKDKPPIQTSDAVGGDGKVNKRVLKSRSGHTITLDDSSGGEEITIVDKTGNNRIVVHSPDNSMQIKTDGDLTIEAKGKITLKGTQGVDMQSQADFKISGQTGLDLSTQAQLKLSGTAGAEMSSSAQAKLTGNLVDVQSTGPLSLTGLPIKLN